MGRTDSRVFGSWLSPLLLIGTVLLFQSFIVASLYGGSPVAHPLTGERVLRRGTAFFQISPSAWRVCDWSDSAARIGIVFFFVAMIGEAVRRGTNKRWRETQPRLVYQFCTIASGLFVLTAFICFLLSMIFSNYIDKLFFVTPAP